MCLSADSEQRQAIKIWRDTGAFQSVILCDVLSFNDASAQGSEVLVRGFGGGFLSMPFHNINLQSDLVSGDVVVVALASQIPIDGVSPVLSTSQIVQMSLNWYFQKYFLFVQLLVPC